MNARVILCISATLLSSLISCSKRTAIIGTWTDATGHQMIFREDGKWLDHGGSTGDIVGRYKFVGRQQIEITGPNIPLQVLTVSINGEEMTLERHGGALKLQRGPRGQVHNSPDEGTSPPHHHK
jgi:hypothetical protein